MSQSLSSLASPLLPLEVLVEVAVVEVPVLVVPVVVVVEALLAALV